MIGSFWNLCRACPSMPVDRLHSEYRSTYRWHEFTGSSRPEVVRRAPLPHQLVPANEPPLPRRKKCPELAYKSHEFIMGSENISDSRNHATIKRARPQERGVHSRRSKSEGRPDVSNGRTFQSKSDLNGTGAVDSTAQAGESRGQFKKTISKLSTEYRLQFVWPNVRIPIQGQPYNQVEPPRKSKSMGTIRAQQANGMSTAFKKRTTYRHEGVT